ncbi:MAG: hypothetical protein HYZ20_15285 [Burkholderiales bacterium]|nr:hypothetical protein [Burkholderiales bacterium]
MRAVWISGLAALALFAGLAVHLAPLEPGVVALQFAATPRAFGEIVHLWSPQDLQRYRAHLAPDMLLLAAYGAFGHQLATRTRVFAPLAPGARAAARWLMPAAALADAAENALHAWLTEAPRFDVPHLYAISAGAAALKWALLVAYAMLIVLALLRARD